MKIVYSIFFSLLTISFLFSYNAYHVELAQQGEKDLQHGDFSHAHLVGINLSGCNISHANFKGAHLNKANLSFTDASHATFDGAEMSGINLYESNCSHASFKSAILTKACLNKVQAPHADFSFAQLNKARAKKANFDHSAIQRTNFNGTKLEQTTFRCAMWSEMPVGYGYHPKIDFEVYTESELDEILTTLEQLRLPESFENAHAPMPQNIYVETLCNICKRQFGKRHNVAIFTCGHTFCKQCADSWLHKDQVCPICRSEITSYCTVKYGILIAE